MDACTQRVHGVRLSAELDPDSRTQVIPGSNQYRFNYWGYSTIGFFAPMARYSAAAAGGGGGADVVNEFKTLVRECHKRGIEVGALLVCNVSLIVCVMTCERQLGKIM